MSQCYCIEITKISWTTWILWPEIREAGNIFKNTCCVNFFKNFLTKNTWCIWNHVVPGIFAYDNLKEVFWKKKTRQIIFNYERVFFKKKYLTFHPNSALQCWMILCAMNSFFKLLYFQVYFIILLYIPKFKIKRHLYYLHILK